MLRRCFSSIVRRQSYRWSHRHLSQFSGSVQEEFDLVVIGSGPSAQKCAINAAKMKHRVAIVDKKAMIGGVCLHTGTIPSKTFREAVLYLTGYRQRGFYGKDHTERDRINYHDIRERIAKVERWETEIVFDQLRRNNITVIGGTASFVDPNHLHIESDASEQEVQEETIIKANNVLIACGTHPARPTHFSCDFDGRYVCDSDQILNNEWILPQNLIVIGCGVIALEYASMLNALPGTRVTIIDSRPEVLGFVDRDALDVLKHSMRNLGASFRLNENVRDIKVEDEKVHVELESNKLIHGDALLYCVGRQGNTASLNLDAAGLSANKRGLIDVNENYQTQVSHIYAAGDVIGFPALASTAMEQGRIASNHMFGIPSSGFPKVFPYGIYTIPEISMVGQTEADLTSQSIPYEVGIARFEELAKGQMLGLRHGFLKLLFCPKTLRLLGCNAIGEHATEIIHIGQVVLSLGGTVDYFRDNVFNYPTFAEAYRVAAIDGLGRLG